MDTLARIIHLVMTVMYSSMRSSSMPALPQQHNTASKPWSLHGCLSTWLTENAASTGRWWCPHSARLQCSETARAAPTKWLCCWLPLLEAPLESPTHHWQSLRDELHAWACNESGRQASFSRREQGAESREGRVSGHIPLPRLTGHGPPLAVVLAVVGRDVDAGTDVEWDGCLCCAVSDLRVEFRWVSCRHCQVWSCPAPEVGSWSLSVSQDRGTDESGVVVEHGRRRWRPTRHRGSGSTCISI